MPLLIQFIAIKHIIWCNKDHEIVRVSILPFETPWIDKWEPSEQEDFLEEKVSKNIKCRLMKMIVKINKAHYCNSRIKQPSSTDPINNEVMMK